MVNPFRPESPMPEPRAAAFERVFRADHAALVAFCFRRVDDYELARDLTAETFRIAWSRWDEPRRSDRAWLFGVARNLIGNEYRRRAGRPTPFPLDDAEALDARAESRFDAIEVHAALATLPAAQQELLRLTYWDGLSAAEAAESLGITPAAVWVRLTRARRAFAHAWHDQNPQALIVPTRTHP
ncbi:RNA polymerase sigma factor [Amnibacterium setariae]|uniref:RNA polymerase sigma factor n=1 Tax=Amnibacterium setariae TaxID=2306585 RepID=UPI001314474B|nr:sigma-70 family RNA polymerase sigma factor [Amnibacterium setariae]